MSEQTATQTQFATIEEAIDEIRRGRMVVVCDDENRENEGDLTLAAQFATPEAINFMAKEGRGLICLALSPERCDELELNLMAAKNEAPLQTAFTVSVEAREGVTTGISAADRAHTIQVAIDARSTPESLVQPGHVFPLRAKDGGVLERAGQTEAAIDLARLAGLNPAGVICEIMNDDGTMARVPDLVPYCERHGLKMVTVADLIAYRRRTERLVERIVATKLPTKFGEFSAVGYRSLVDDKHHVAMVKGEVDVMTGWLTNTTYLKTLGTDRVDMRLWDAGVRLYARPTTPRSRRSTTARTFCPASSGPPAKDGSSRSTTGKRPWNCWSPSSPT